MYFEDLISGTQFKIEYFRCSLDLKKCFVIIPADHKPTKYFQGFLSYVYKHAKKSKWIKVSS